MRSMIESWKRKTNQYHELKKQKGVTLLEIIIVLGIIGIIAAGVVILAQRAFAAQDTTSVSDSTNTIRTAMTDVYRNTGYPKTAAEYANTTTVAPGALATSTLNNPIIVLAKMGKLSSREALNVYSKEPFQLLPASIGGTNTTGKGFVVVVTGMNSEECRALATQVSGDWDFVESRAAMPAGKAVTYSVIDMSIAPSGTIGKTLASSVLNPSFITTTMCAAAGSNNGLLLGSR